MKIAVVERGKGVQNFYVMQYVYRWLGFSGYWIRLRSLFYPKTKNVVLMTGERVHVKMTNVILVPFYTLWRSLNSFLVSVCTKVKIIAFKGENGIKGYKFHKMHMGSVLRLLCSRNPSSVIFRSALEYCDTYNGLRGENLKLSYAYRN